MISSLFSMFGSVGKGNGGTGIPQKNAALQRPTREKTRVKGKTPGGAKGAKLRDALHSLELFQNIAFKDGASGIVDDKYKSKSILSATIVESTDRNKNPYLFIRFDFADDGVEVDFSIPPEVPNPSLRALQVSRTLFTVLSLLESRGVFIPDRADLYQKTMEFFDAALDFAGADCMTLKYHLDRYTAENSSLKIEMAKLKSEKEGLNHGVMELERRCQEQEERVRQLERLTDSELEQEIIKWVEEHNGKLSPQKFCSAFGMGRQRLEERLDSLSKRGVVRLA